MHKSRKDLEGIQIRKNDINIPRKIFQFLTLGTQRKCDK